jgi:tRNA pseudouridine55 synthase
MQFPFKIKSEKVLDSYSLEELQKGVVICVDKPLEWTSFQVVNKIKYFIKKKFSIKKIKIGHAGTLDPLASGLLIICIGKATKQIESFQMLPKVYSGIIQLGATTPSFDLETAIDQRFSTDHIDSKAIDSIRSEYLGYISQVPPLYSALKVNGQRAYKIARKGEEVNLASREIQIHNIDLTYSKYLQQLSFVVKCSKGTYIRSLANDIGKSLNSGGHLIELKRESIGDYSI